MAWASQAGLVGAGTGEVSGRVAEAFLASLGAVSGNTWNKYRGLLAQVWDGSGGDNPWRRIRRARQVSLGRRGLSRAEADRLVEGADGEWRGLYLVGLWLGLRLSDALALRWEDLEPGWSGPGWRPLWAVVAPGKGRAREQVLRLPVAGVLASWMAEWRGMGEEEEPRMDTDGHGWGKGGGLRAGPPGPLGEGRVFPGLAGMGVWRVCRVAAGAIREACGDAAAPERYGSGRPVVRLGFHSLRHTLVTWLAESGAPEAVVEAMVGHGSPAMRRLYTHVGGEALRRAVGAAERPGIGD
jgi:integrase